MEFRVVDPRFRCLALIVQLALLAAIAAYVVYQVTLVMVSEPPTSITWDPWNVGAGKWAICSAIGGELTEAGIGVKTGPTKHLDGWKLSAEDLLIDGNQRKCSVVDLSEWDVPDRPTGFNLCCGGLFSCDVFTWTGSRWQYFWSLSNSGIQYLSMSLSNRMNQNGSTTTFISRNFLDSWQTAPTQKHDDCQVLSRFTSAEPGYAIMRIEIADLFVTNVRELSVQQQMWDILGKVGGYLTIAAMLFNFVFVKKYPNMAFAQAYEARTLITERIGSSQSQADEEATLPSRIAPPGTFGRGTE
ncbi:purM [Symbiodinium sp. CCMP2456]|nr:purM [Symbiodinium sp. CCMP2456]